MRSLDKALAVIGVRFVLGGHESALPDYYDAVDRSQLANAEKIGRVDELCAVPRAILEISTQGYGSMGGYSELLKLGQTGSPVEYLNQRG